MKSVDIRIVSFAAIAAVTGCANLPSVGPDYKSPEDYATSSVLPDAGLPTEDLTETYEYKPASSNEDVRVEISNEYLARWWERLNDPILASLVENAISNNVDFLIAQRRLEQSLWQMVGTTSAFMPRFSLDGSATRNELHRNNRSVQGAYRHKEMDVFNGGLNATWEIDVFGGSRRSTEAAIARAQAAVADVDQAWVTLTTQIGEKYISLRTTQERIAVARTNLVLQTETYDILKSRLDSGIGDELAVHQCAYVVETTRAKIPLLLAEEESLKNAIAILAGEMPGSFSDLLQPDLRRDWLMAPNRVAELPLDMIRSRPDVKSAERRLAAQIANVGVAKSQWYPRLFINGGVGMEATHASKFAQPGSFYASIGPSVSWPFFQGGNVYASVKEAEAAVEEARLNYERTLDHAHAEVRNAYFSYTQEYHRYKALQAAVKAATEAVSISKDLYKNGLKDFNNVLDAQRSRLDLEEQLAVSRGQITTDLIKLYGTLGGGLATGSVDAE